MAASREELDREKAAIIAEIYAAFEGVSREGGISWTESRSIDCPPPTCPPRDQARAMDKDTSWTQLVDDPAWRADMGVGGFAFLDDIGWRYYLPAAMVRELNGGDTTLMHSLHLTEQVEYPSVHEWQLELWQLLDRRQKRCVRRFVEFMVGHSLAASDEFQAQRWREGLDAYWATVE